MLMSDLVSATGRCLSVEPNPVICDSLEASLAVNGFAQRSSVIRCAPTENKHSEVRVFIPHLAPKNAHIMTPAESVDWSKGRAVNVPSKTLDNICAGMRVDFVRIDSNGMEPAVFQGMKGLIERDKPNIVVRFNSRRISDPQGFLDAMAAHYPVFRYLDLDGRLKPLTVTDLRERRVQDPLLFLSQEKNL
jgi:FkbM family methyltransferase